MSPVTAPQHRKFWRSLAELEDAPEFTEFLHREFPAAASELPDGVSRRRWLQLMGASLAFAGVAGCRWPAEQIATFAVRPENRIPGVPQYCATSIDVAGAAHMLLATSFDGRPVKLEGNPDHPESGGATDAFSQALILGLYDPDRSDRVRELEHGKQYVRTWDDFVAFARRHFERLRAADGAGLALLCEPTTSPTMQMMQERFSARFPQAKVFVYGAAEANNAAEGSRLAFGRPIRTRFALDRATVCLTLDADLFGGHPSALKYAREWMQGRDPHAKRMNRLFVVESQFSLTGANADHRRPIPSTDVPRFLTRLDDAVREQLGQPRRWSSSSPYEAETENWLQVLAAELIAHRGEGVIAIGPAQPAAVHALAHDLNRLLGNLGKTVLLSEEPGRVPEVGEMATLTSEMRAGRVDTLVVVGGNPVYDAPGDLEFSKALENVETSIRLGLYEDETSQGCRWHLPQAHPLESWGDARAFDGTLGVSQPLIAPLLGGKSAVELLTLLTGEETADALQSVRLGLERQLGRDLSNEQWRRAIHDGFVAESQLPTIEVAPAGGSEGEWLEPLAELADSPFAQTAARAPADGSPVQLPLELVFYPSRQVYDGQFANNGWLQELPDHLTKLTWDNAALIAPETAEQLGISQGDVVRIEHHGRAIEVPAFLLPGQAAGSIGVALGYGRTHAGYVGGDVDNGIMPVGVDVNPLRQWQSLHVLQDVSVRPTGRRAELATTQDHFAIDKLGLKEIGHRVGELVRETSWFDFLHGHEQNGGIGHGHGHGTDRAGETALWAEPSYDGHAWGMSIDLNKCIGCNACVMACQAENNVPVVGKDQVAKGREMHWLRVDRYFTGDAANPSVATQPVACHHCENAPCEQVCPVAATVHSDEGLNDMVYNRCIGTRYCANNCPYKVRRFNFFNYNAELEDANRQLVQLAVNPEVTVRSRGVMEKCTYCVQRIQSVKIGARNEQRAIRDGEIKTACQQACPTQAIEFGDLNQQSSQVAERHADRRAYGMLAELNIKPRTKYLQRIRNPHLKLIVNEDGPHPERQPEGHGNS